MALLTAILRRCPGLARCLLLPVLALAVPRTGAAEGGTEPAAEYQVKAAFLFNFAQFVEWPRAAFADDKAPLVIAIAGRDPFGTYLDNLVRGEKIGSHPIVVRRLGEGDNPEGAHILFVRLAGSSETDEMLARARELHVLTVGDAENFNRLGGMVRFVTENGKIRLRINVVAAKDARLVISSKLLRWATIVTPD